jgi:phosphotransferase family enzyme
MKNESQAAVVLRRLVDAGFLTNAEIVQGDVALHNLSRSNAVFLACVGNSRRCLVKRATMADRADHADVARERAISRLVTEQASLSFAPVPKWLGDIDELLVLEAIDPGDSLEDRQQRDGTIARDGRLLGEALAAWRRASTSVELDLPPDCPWVLSSLDANPPAFLTDNPRANELIELLRPDPILARSLASLRESWQPNALVHGDIRWNNVLISSRNGVDHLILVDWEFAHRGEPAWDLAGAMSEAIAGEALIERPSDAEYNPPSAGELVEVIHGVRGYLRALGTGYQTEALDGTACIELNASPPYVAARLLHNAFQHAIWDPANGMAAARVTASVASTLFAHPEALSAIFSEPVADRSGQVQPP